ncbi:MAG: TRAP transporter substrate-binding protein [Spirochaetales bacterium]
MAVLTLALPAGLICAESKTLYLRLAELHPSDHPTSKGDREFARQVAELSKGRIQVEVYDNGVLGDELSVMEQLRFGAIDLARVSIASVQPFVPQLAALFLPYLYRDDDHLWKVLSGPVGQQLLADLKAGGQIGIGWFEAGARSFYTARTKLQRASDLVGLRIRVQESPPMVRLVETLGAKALPLPFPNVYSGLRTGALDGAENNLVTYYASSHYQVAPFFTLDEHARLPELLIGSPLAFSQISQADQALLLQAAAAAAVTQRAAFQSYEAEIRDKLVTAGVTFFEPVDLASWQARARRIWSEQTPQVRELLERIRNTQ